MLQVEVVLEGAGRGQFMQFLLQRVTNSFNAFQFVVFRSIVENRLQNLE